MKARELTRALRANKPTKEVKEHETGRVEECVSKDGRAGKNLKLSLRGSVEKQTQHGLGQIGWIN